MHGLVYMELPLDRVLMSDRMGYLQFAAAGLARKWKRDLQNPVDAIIVTGRTFEMLRGTTVDGADLARAVIRNPYRALPSGFVIPGERPSHWFDA